MNPMQVGNDLPLAFLHTRKVKTGIFCVIQVDLDWKDIEVKFSKGTEEPLTT